MKLPMSPLVLPRDLIGQPNGTLDPSLLVSIGNKGTLHKLAARSWRAFVAEGLSNGLPLTYTFGGTYRTFNQQATLFRQRFTTSLIQGARRKWWNGQWWYLRPGAAEAATPGTSNHGLGLAIDAAFDKDISDGIGPDDAASIAGHPKFSWFRDNAIRFGFSFELQSEPWHIRYVAGDNIPKAVLDYEASITGSPAFPPFKPELGQWSLWPIANKPAAKLGDVGDHVKYLQGVLKLKAGQNIGTIDGSFGPKTELAVENLQRFFKLSIDGWVGAQTWSVVDMISSK
jgi:hypothetical protein